MDIRSGSADLETCIEHLQHTILRVILLLRTEDGQLAHLLQHTFDFTIQLAVGVLITDVVGKVSEQLASS